MASPPFRILPFDFFPAPLEAPPLGEAIHISGAMRQFELLPRGGRVYFRLAGEHARLWATLDDSDDPNPIRVLRRAIGSGRIGRIAQLRPDTTSLAYFLVAANGSIQVREWCSTCWTDLPFDLETSTSGAGIFDPRFRLPTRKFAFKAHATLETQPLSPEERQLTALRWMGGSEDEWKQLLDALILFCPDNTSLFATLVYDRDKAPWQLNGANNAFECYGLEHVPLLLETINAHFRVVGVKWIRRHPFELLSQRELEAQLQLRSGWDWSYWNERWLINNDLSAHERLEALLFLRSWLLDKLTPTQTEEILRHVHI